ncbi:MAG: hypothetical protein HY313_09285, partial [Acidobacteria bacterium]|nr:hypothetical protein [Acidobacteriota bacterium]
MREAQAMIAGKNEYSIQHKIRTVALLPCVNRFREIDFFPYHPGNPDWIATKNQSGGNFREAYTTFVQELIEITDALSVICHCSFSLLGTTYLVHKLNTGSQPFFAHVAEIEPTGTVSVFLQRYIQDLEKLTSADCKVALHFLRESNNA